MAAGAGPGSVTRCRIVAQVAGAAFALLLFGLPVPAPAASRHPKEPRTEIGVVIVSGAFQAARAYASPGARSYVTEPRWALVAHIVGKDPRTHRVRYSCSNGCSLHVPNEPTNGKQIDPSTYETDATNGQAALKVALTVPRPGYYAVWVQPVGDGDERIRRSAFLIAVR